MRAGRATLSAMTAETGVSDAEGGMAEPEQPEYLVLAGEFPATERERWLELVDGVLRKAKRLADDADPGAGEALLVRTTEDGFPVRPLYTRDDALDAGLPGLAPFTRGTRAAGAVPGGWDIRVRHDVPDPAVTRPAVLADLEHGAGSVWLRVDSGDPSEGHPSAMPLPKGAPRSPARGTGSATSPGIAVGDLAKVLADVDLELAAVVLDPGAEVTRAADAFFALVADRGADPARVRGSLGADPVGLRARTGDGPPVDSVAPLVERVRGTGLAVVTVDALPFHEAGGSDGQELGCSLAAGVAYLRALAGAGVDVADAAALLEFRYAATADQFATISKLRAARRLWARVLEASGVEPARRGQLQHAVTSPAMLTRRDPWVNMLRGTVAAFAAGTGGAQAITVAPFDAAIGIPDGFARRIARNTHALLVAEAHVARVVDPAGGSWYVEQRTESLARAAWAWFQEIERAGGIVAALDGGLNGSGPNGGGLVADRLGVTARRRADAVARRSRPIVGVSEFAFPDEQPVRRPPAPAEPGGGPTFKGLPRLRHAAPYESLRDSADAHRDATGARPRVVLATLGPIAEHAVRAGFARTLFAAGGVEAPDTGATESTSDLVDGATELSAVACLCGADAAYRDRGAEAAAALRSAGVQRVLLAGPPSLEVSGVDGYLYAGCDALAALADVHSALGLTKPGVAGGAEVES